MKSPALSTQFVRIHGHDVAYRVAGEGPVVLLVHGIAGSSATWSRVMPDLAEHYTVVAPDLLGHGESAKPRGDYSLGAYASGIRDQRVSARDRLYLAAEVPTLIVWGDRDRIIPVAHAHLTHELIPGSRLVVVEGAGHFLPVEHPAAFLEALEDFLATTEPAPADD